MQQTVVTQIALRNASVARNVARPAGLGTVRGERERVATLPETDGREPLA